MFINKIRKLPLIAKLLNHSDFRTKVLLYMSTKTAGVDYDSDEQNYTYTNLNPITINAYVSEVSAEGLVFKAYGLQNIGAKSILCEAKYKNMFENCNKITIDGDNYTVFREGTGSKTLISNRPKGLIRVIIQRND